MDKLGVAMGEKEEIHFELASLQVVATQSGNTVVLRCYDATPARVSAEVHGASSRDARLKAKARERLLRA